MKFQLPNKRVKTLTDERNRLERDRDEIEAELRWRRRAMEGVESICKQDLNLNQQTNPHQVLLAMELAEPGEWK